jgi:nitroimidazol reductase NimA-like FMN-containing flavoprotein (pyridoxamine 5'-phosphate oxidase superfamily)
LYCNKQREATVSTPTARTAGTRLRERLSHDTRAAYQVLDETLECRLGFVVDGTPRILPTLQVRDGDTVYLHCSTGSPVARAAAGGGVAVCVEASLIDGLVLARSQFHHSVNYRSVVVHGVAVPVTDPATKTRVLGALVDKVGRHAAALLGADQHGEPRSAHTRPPDARELAQTAVLALPLGELSAKRRAAGVGDDPADLALPYWAGVLPLRRTAGAPQPDDGVSADLPGYLGGA